MSTAVAEPETKETPTEPAQKPHPGAITIDLDNLLSKPKPVEKKSEEVEKPEDLAAKEAAAKEAELKSKEADAKAAESASKSEKAKANTKEENLANLRIARENAEKAAREAAEERDRLRKEIEDLRAKAPELPEDVKGKLSKFEEIEKEREELRKSLRQADLARDPEFREKYQKQIAARIGIMEQVALSAGVSKEDWHRNAIAGWNEEQFAEWRESMTAAQRVKFDAAWTSAVSLHQEQVAALEDADKSYAELEKQRKLDAETQQRQYIQQNETLGKSVLAEVLKPVSSEDYPDLADSATAVVMQAARHELPAKDIFQQLAYNQILARVTQKQKGRIEELEAKIAEHEKKIAEQDAFIANQAGAIPRGDAAGKVTDLPDDKPVWESFRVKMPG